jgi:hypothetical protein
MPWLSPQRASLKGSMGELSKTVREYEAELRSNMFKDVDAQWTDAMCKVKVTDNMQ